MSKLPALTGDEVVAALERGGFSVIRARLILTGCVVKTLGTKAVT